MTPDEVLVALGRARAIAILRTGEAAQVRPALDAALRGGLRILEVTLSTPGALAALAHLSRDPALVVGAGTVLSADEARRAVEHGARFLVSPVVDHAVIAAARDCGVVMIPGALTPSELLAAHRAGAPLQKLFPAPADGPEYVRACLGPLPFLRLVPTSGVRLDNARAYLDAGAFALGFVRSLFEPADLARGDYEAIERRARAIVDLVSR